MSKTRTAWETLDDTKQLGLSDFFDKHFGRYFSNGLNIGREVTGKLEAIRSGNTQDIQVWPTLLQAQGLDSGLTAGFLTACGICPLGTDENPLEHLPGVMQNIFGVTVVFDLVENTEQLAEKYPAYVEYPDKQQWSLPGIMILYSTASE